MIHMFDRELQVVDTMHDWVCDTLAMAYDKVAVDLSAEQLEHEAIQLMHHASGRPQHKGEFSHDQVLQVFEMTMHRAQAIMEIGAKNLGRVRLRMQARRGVPTLADSGGDGRDGESRP